jgi:benzoylsuccinyl-CoA thiolase BbsA subunit
MNNAESRPVPKENDSQIPIRPGLFEYPSPENSPPAILGNRCRKCAQMYFPKRMLCTNCFTEGDLEPVRLSRRGRIFSSTVVHIPSPAGISAPYAYGYVDLDGDRLRVFALFSGTNPAAFRPGCEVELIIEPVRTDSEGRVLIGYKFRLA